MQSNPLRLAVALAATLAATAVLAQGNPIARGNAQAQAGQGVVMDGFFRPTPDGDPSLTKYRPPASAAPAPAPAPMQAQAVAAPAQVIAVPVRAADSNPVTAPAAVSEQRWAEQQLDRAERESERDRQRAASTLPPVAPGAWDGTTDPRNR
jgi:hypothetical protein